jgi:hypothetical protein
MKYCSIISVKEQVQHDVNNVDDARTGPGLLEHNFDNDSSDEFQQSVDKKNESAKVDTNTNESNLHRSGNGMGCDKAEDSDDNEEDGGGHMKKAAEAVSGGEHDVEAEEEAADMNEVAEAAVPAHGEEAAEMNEAAEAAVPEAEHNAVKRKEKDKKTKFGGSREVKNECKGKEILEVKEAEMEAEQVPEHIEEKKKGRVHAYNSNSLLEKIQLFREKNCKISLA